MGLLSNLLSKVIKNNDDIKYFIAVNKSIKNGNSNIIDKYNYRCTFALNLTKNKLSLFAENGDFAVYKFERVNNRHEDLGFIRYQGYKSLSHEKVEIIIKYPEEIEPGKLSIYTIGEFSDIFTLASIQLQYMIKSTKGLPGL